MDRDIKVRKLKGLLYTAGAGMMIFAVWGILRIFLTFILTPGLFPEDLTLAEKAVSVIAVLIIIAIDFGIRYKICASAMARAKGEKTGSFYLVLTWLLMIISLLTVAVSVYGIFSQDTGFSGLGSVFLDLTTAVILAEILIFSHELKKAEA